MTIIDVYRYIPLFSQHSTNINQLFPTRLREFFSLERNRIRIKISYSNIYIYIEREILIDTLSRLTETRKQVGRHSFQGNSIPRKIRNLRGRKICMIIERQHAISGSRGRSIPEHLSYGDTGTNLAATSASRPRAGRACELRVKPTHAIA